MSFRWPVLALAISAISWILPLIIGSASGKAGSAGAPVWVVACYVIAGLAFLAFIGLLVASLALRSRA